MRSTSTLLLRTLMLVIISGASFQCSKDDSEDMKKPAEILVGTWVVVADAINPPINSGSGLISDIFALYDPCDKDDLFTMRANNTGDWDEGASKCDPSDPQTESFSWLLQDSDKTLILTDGVDVASFDVVQLDNAVMKLAIKDTFNGVEYTETITYNRKK